MTQDVKDILRVGAAMLIGFIGVWLGLFIACFIFSAIVKFLLSP
jgi:hypothetical protein